MTLNEILILIRTIAESKGYDKPMSKVQYNAYLKKANIDLFKRIYGFFKDGVKADFNQLAIDALRPFKEVNTAFVVAEDTGQASYPADYFHIASAVKVSIANYYPVDFVTDTELWDRMNDGILAPTAYYPIGCLFDTYIQFYPANIGTLTLTYWRYPVDPIYATTVTNGVPTYDSGNSTQLEWDSAQEIDIIRLILSYINLSVEDKELLAYMDNKEIMET